jgi:serine/threonine protein kinase
MFLQVLDAVSYAHRQGIVHRDIKPSNIMLAKDGTLKVFDFGIAKLADETSPSLTRTGAKIGTVLYMSPEQVKGLPVDLRSDIYSLGVTLFQMLTGKSPYDTISHNEFDISLSIVTEPLPLPQNPYFELPAALYATILKATEKNSDKRYASCYEFAEALHGCAQEIAAKESEANLPHISPQELMAETFAIPESPEKKWLPYLAWGVVLFFVLLALGFKNADYLKNIFLVKQHSETELKARIYDYYKNVETHNFEKVKPFYAKRVEKYFGKTDQTSADLQAVAENYWVKTPKEDHVIAWETFTVKEEADGHYVVRFTMTYHYQRANKPWQEQKANTQISLDNRLKIYSIVGVK